MAKTFIGIDIDDSVLRIVALEENGNALSPVALVQRRLGDVGETAETVAGVLNEWDTGNARLAMALPARHVLGRRLPFPFGDRKKITAAVPLELGSRLPVDLKDYHLATLAPVQEDEKFLSFGLAVPNDQIGTTLSPFDERQLPLRVLGIAPFAYIGLLGEQQDGILIHARTDEISTLLVLGGAPAGYRTRVRPKNRSNAETADAIFRDVMALQKSNGSDDLPVLMFGSGLDSGLQESIKKVLPTADVPGDKFEDELIPAEFVPALSLARLAATPAQSLNLRQGRYAYRGSLAPFKKQLIAAAVLVLVTLVSLVGGTWFSYAAKASIAKGLLKQMRTVYTQTFPDAGEPPKDIPLHMTSRLNEARNQSRLFGGPGAPPLATLEAVSRVFPENATSLIRELVYNEEGLRLSGEAASFDAVDQLAAKIESQPIFSSSRISDAKMNIEGKQVDFRIDVTFAGTGGRP